MLYLITIAYTFVGSQLATIRGRGPRTIVFEYSAANLYAQRYVWVFSGQNIVRETDRLFQNKKSYIRICTG